MPSEGRHSRQSGAYFPQLQQQGLNTISNNYGVATTCRRMYLAAAEARATRMSLLWAGQSGWRTMAGATLSYGTDDYTTAGSRPTRQSEARDSDSELP